MKHKRVKIPVACLLLFMSWLPAIVQAQNSRSEEPVLYLTLQEAIDRADVQNVQVEIAERDIEIARGAYRQTHATFLPQLSIEETGVATNDPLHVFGYRLKQESVTPIDFDPGRLNDPGRFDNFSTRLALRQPLLNADRFFERRSVSHNVKAAREALRGTKAHIRYQVKDVYYRLQLSSQQRFVLEQTLQTARENDRQATELYDQEMINRADMLAARVRVLELESHLSGIENQIQDIQGELRYLMDVEEKVDIVATDSLQKVSARTGLSIESASLQNGTLRAMEHSISAAKESLKASQWSALPSINLFGSYEFNDEIPFGTRGNGYMVGATLRWELFSGLGRSGKSMESKARLRQAKLLHESERVEQRLEVDQAQRSLKQAGVQLRFTEAAIEQSKEDYRIRNDRYSEGLESTTDLLSSESSLLQARFRRLEALYQYNMAQATLELLLEPEFQ